MNIVPFYLCWFFYRSSQSVSCYTAVHATLLIHGPPHPDNEETNDDGDVYPKNQAVHSTNNLTADPDALTERQRHNPGQQSIRG